MIAKNVVGVDYHNKFVQICVLNEQGEQLGNKKCGNDVMEVISYISKFGEVSSLAIESCIGAANFADELGNKSGWKVELAHSGYVSRMKMNPQKTDYSDSRLLGDLSRVGYLPKVWLAPERIRDLRSLVRYRYQIVQRSTAMKLKIRGLLRNHRIEHAIGHKLWTKEGLAWLRSLSLGGVAPEHASWIIGRYLKELKRLSEEKKEAEKRLKESVFEDITVAKLLKIKGIGLITACVMRAEIGDFSRFRTGKQLANFCGVCPHNSSSGERTSDSGMIRSGNRLLKMVIIETAHRLVRYENKWRCFAKMLSARGKRNSVIVAAVANRWIRKLHREIICVEDLKLAA